MIFNYIAWWCNLTDDFSIDRVRVREDKRENIIAQYLNNLTSQWRHLKPKRATHGLTITHLTGSANLQQLLNTIRTLNLIPSPWSMTQLWPLNKCNEALLLLKAFTPMFSPLWHGYSDFIEETLTGKPQKIVYGFSKYQIVFNNTTINRYFLDLLII